MKRRTAATAAWLAGALALALGFWACTNDAGDTPGVPTGPETQYNPLMDYPGARITVTATPDTVPPGGEFDLVSYFTDAEGRPVVGVPLIAEAEAGGAVAPHASAGCFTFFTNPTLTGSNGRASIGVRVSETCPNESYTFLVKSSQPGPNAHGLGEIHVRGDGAATMVALVATPTSVPVGGEVIFTATANVSCDPIFEYRVEGGGYSIFWEGIPGGVNPRVFKLTPTVAGQMAVIVRARCPGSTINEYSPQVNVTVSVETVSTPGTPTGPTTLNIPASGTYTTTGSTSSVGHALEYQWRIDGSVARPWGTAGTTASLTFSGTAGSVPKVTVEARCATHTSIVSTPSAPLSVTLN